MTEAAAPEPTDAAPAPVEATPLKRTPLHGSHVLAGARMVPFAGYDMPIHYGSGSIITEHSWTRGHAGLFDVSHMGQAFLTGPDHDTTARAFEALVPADILSMKPGQQRYTQLLTEDGGILDDLMVTRPTDPDEDGVLMLVVNAACKEADFAHISAKLPANVKLMRAEHRALLAIQGPKAAEVMARHCPGSVGMAFMTARAVTFDAIPCHVSRSGYTGEDGFEISVVARKVEFVWRGLLSNSEVRPIGLGARDTLRLEAGLCLYGHDIDTTTSPVEAGLAWSIQKRRRAEGGFPGAARVLGELAGLPKRRRVGLLPDGPAPAREGTEIQTPDGQTIGTVTSGGFGPSLQKPIAMGYVTSRFSEPGTPVCLMVRGRALTAKVVPLPFHPHRYVRA
jgi:aminomethyltransferase